MATFKYLISFSFSGDVLDLFLYINENFAFKDINSLLEILLIMTINLGDLKIDCCRMFKVFMTIKNIQNGS